jgi:hypothetical protein
MSIHKTSPNTDNEDDLFEEIIDDEGTHFSPRALLDEITRLEDCILVIPEGELERLKKNLTKRKARDNAKMKSAGVPVDTRVLSFIAYPAKDKTDNVREGLLEVRVRLGERRNLTVLEIRKPSDEL